MAKRLERHEILPGVFINTVEEKNYKVNRLSFHMMLPAKREQVTTVALLSKLLEKGCADYPTLAAMNDRLAELYGARFSVGVYKVGDWQNIVLQITSIANHFTLKGEDLLNQCTAFLIGILFSPKRAEGKFDEVDLLLEKGMLEEQIRGEMNDKRLYARRKCIQAMCEGEAYALPRLGFLEEVRGISQAQLGAVYQALISSARTEIFGVGADSFEKSAALIQKAFQGVRRAPEALPAFSPKTPPRGTVQLVNESMDLAQSKLVLGFEMQKSHTLREDMVARLMTMVYGATPNSKLFLNVRERLSLCYYCSASYDFYRALLLVDSGIEAPSKDAAVEEILHQLDAMKAGLFLEQDLESAKRTMRSNLESVFDEPWSVESYYLSGALSGLSAEPEAKIAQLETIKAEELTAMAGTVHLNTVYFLSPAAGNLEEPEEE